MGRGARGGSTCARPSISTGKVRRLFLVRRYQFRNQESLDVPEGQQARFECVQGRRGECDGWVGARAAVGVVVMDVLVGVNEIRLGVAV
jgi:hypothetical protein